MTDKPWPEWAREHLESSHALPATDPELAILAERATERAHQRHAELCREYGARIHISPEMDKAGFSIAFKRPPGVVVIINARLGEAEQDREILYQFQLLRELWRIHSEAEPGTDPDTLQERVTAMCRQMSSLRRAAGGSGDTA